MLAAEKGKLVCVGSDKAMTPVKTQRPIIELSPAYDLAAGELTSEGAFRFRIVIDPAGLPQRLRVAVAHRGDHITFALGSRNLQGIVVGVAVTTKLKDIHVPQIGTNLVG